MPKRYPHNSSLEFLLSSHLDGLIIISASNLLYAASAQPFQIDTAFQRQNACGTHFLVKFIHRTFYFWCYYINFHLVGSAMTSVVSHFSIYSRFFFYLVCLSHMAKLILAVFSSMVLFFVLSVFLVHVSFPMFNFTFAFDDKGVHPKSQFIWENRISPFLEVAINCCVILPVEF